MREEMSRRTLAGLTLAAAGSAPGCATADSGDVRAAYAPWHSWRNDPEEGVPGLLRSAVLAANAHDTQPWRFCVGRDRIAIHADESRNLGAMDPFRREMHLSLGCAVENLILAAGAQGHAARLDVEPGVLAGPVTGAAPAATLSLIRGGTASPLVAAIPSRHTNRGVYTEQPVRAELLAELRSLAQGEPARVVLLTDAGARRDFAAATDAATAAIIADATMIADSDAWFRATDAEIARHRDGPTIAAAGLSPMTEFLARILPTPSPEKSHDYWLSQTRDVQLATASVFGLIAVPDRLDRAQTIAAGRLWQRLHLMGTLRGLAMQPLNQLPEMADRERQLGKPAASEKLLASLAGDPIWQPTFAFRLGWPVRPAPPSPRRAIEDVVAGGDCGAATR